MTRGTELASQIDGPAILEHPDRCYRTALEEARPRKGCLQVSEMFPQKKYWNLLPRACHEPTVFKHLKRQTIRKNGTQSVESDHMADCRAARMTVGIRKGQSAMSTNEEGS